MNAVFESGYAKVSLIAHTCLLILLVILLPRQVQYQEFQVSLVADTPLQTGAGNQSSPYNYDSEKLRVPGLRESLPSMIIPEPERLDYKSAALPNDSTPTSTNETVNFEFSADEILFENENTAEISKLSNTQAEWESGGGMLRDSLDYSDLSKLTLTQSIRLRVILNVSKEGLILSFSGAQTGNTEIDESLSTFIRKLSFRPADQDYSAILLLTLQPGDAF